MTRFKHLLAAVAVATAVLGGAALAVSPAAAAGASLAQSTAAFLD